MTNNDFDKKFDVINSKLLTLEHHIINLILPMQTLTQLLNDNGAIDFFKKTNGVLKIDDRDFREFMITFSSDFRNMVKEIKELFSDYDIKDLINKIVEIANFFNETLNFEISLTPPIKQKVKKSIEIKTKRKKV